MQDILANNDKASARSSSAVITIRDLKKDGDRQFQIERPAHSAVAPACLPLSRGAQLLKSISQLFQAHTRTPDENLATQEIAAIRLRARAEQALKDKLTHINNPTKVGTWVTNEEIDALEHRQMRLVTLISRLRRQRTLLMLLAMLVVVIGGVGPIVHQLMSIQAPPKSKTTGLPATADSTPVVREILQGTQAVVDYGEFAAAEKPTIAFMADQASAPQSPTTNEQASTPTLTVPSIVAPIPDVESTRLISALLAPHEDTIAPFIDLRQILIDQTRGWAEAWGNQNVERYVAFYGAGFVPPNGLSREAWEQERQQRLQAPKRIEITLSDMSADMTKADEEISVRFTQGYQSNTYSDTTRKQLIWRRDSQGEWRIASESSLK
ncbi:MAG: YybH family protein [Gammaproteobacteria bacterium]